MEIEIPKNGMQNGRASLKRESIEVEALHTQHDGAPVRTHKEFSFGRLQYDMAKAALRYPVLLVKEPSLTKGDIQQVSRHMYRKPGKGECENREACVVIGSIPNMTDGPGKCVCWRLSLTQGITV